MGSKTFNINEIGGGGGRDEILLGINLSIKIFNCFFLFLQFVGSSCGQHGTYTFYKGVKYYLEGKQKILALGEFFLLKIWQEEDIIAVGEAQLFWEDKSSGQILVSLRLYFLPENTPDGRTDEHGEVSF